jgi:gamma-glutamyltranspeptidase/glutathione hydrolase
LSASGSGPDPALVAAGHPATAAAAADVLRAGGNAFDAAVAAGFAAAVAEPLLTGLGGGGFLLARTATGEAEVHDFFVDTPGRGLGSVPTPHFLPVTINFPGSAQDFNVGRGSAAVPGTLAGYLEIHARLGRLPITDVVAPAVELAEGGITLDRFQASVFELLWPIVSRSEEGSRWYGRDGGPRRAGDTVRNPELGAFMAAVARDPEVGFYSGSRAARIEADMAAGDGLITAADLAAYRVEVRVPLTVRFRDRTVLTNPPPAFGGTLVALGLELMGERPLRSGAAAEWAATAGCLVELEQLRQAGQVLQRLRSTGGTTHVSVADADGNVAAMTTSNGENSGYVVPGTGVMLNNMLGEDDLHPDGFHGAPPGERVSSMMSPMVVLRDGEVEAVLGSGGSKRIRSALVQVVAGLVDDGLDAPGAVERPRLHWDGEVLQLEPGFDDEVVRALAASWPVNRWDERNLYFGGPHLVRPGVDAAGDPRRGGATAIV